MKAEVINLFIQASMDVIYKTTGYQVSLGKVYRKESPYGSENIVILVGLTGDLKGSVAITLNKALAKDIASKMMGGVPVPELDEMAKSAISELCNMILGNTGMLLSDMGVTIDVTPPTTLTGDNLKFSIQNSVIICVPLMFGQNELLELNISYKTN